METSITNHQKTLAMFIHLSTFSQIFIPFGNFIAPMILWMAQKKDSAFVDDHGRRAINFQLSLFLYSIIIILIAVPIILLQALAIADDTLYGTIDNWEEIISVGEVTGLVVTAIITGIVLIALFVIGIIAVISASINANNGRYYKYPICISFIKPIVNQTESASASSTDNSEGPFNTPQ